MEGNSQILVALPFARDVFFEKRDHIKSREIDKLQKHLKDERLNVTQNINIIKIDFVFFFFIMSWKFFCIIYLFMGI